MGHFEQTCLPQVKEGLAEVFGPDLAESLVNAALSKGENSINQQLLMNDGLNLISEEQREQALELLDILAITLA